MALEKRFPKRKPAGQKATSTRSAEKNARPRPGDLQGLAPCAGSSRGSRREYFCGWCPSGADDLFGFAVLRPGLLLAAERKSTREFGMQHSSAGAPNRKGAFSVLFCLPQPCGHVCATSKLILDDTKQQRKCKDDNVQNSSAYNYYRQAKHLLLEFGYDLPKFPSLLVEMDKKHNKGNTLFPTKENVRKRERVEQERLRQRDRPLLNRHQQLTGSGPRRASCPP